MNLPNPYLGLFTLNVYLTSAREVSYPICLPYLCPGDLLSYMFTLPPSGRSLILYVYHTPVREIPHLICLPYLFTLYVYVTSVREAPLCLPFLCPGSPTLCYLHSKK